ncbi:MAG: hypothetical protein IPK21_07850 [Haliscomenobacter sp.]|nr:hypothetical protein [Haliscomenobacter sp.]
MLINPLTNKPAIQTNARLDKKIARMERIIDAEPETHSGSNRGVSKRRN